MSFKTIAFVSVCMFLGSVAPAFGAADQVHPGQAQVHCSLCTGSVEHDDHDTLWIPCSDQGFTVHTDCMRDYMVTGGHIACPSCTYDFDDNMLETLWAILMPLEEPAAGVQEEAGEEADENEELALVIDLSLQLEQLAQSAADEAYAQALNAAFAAGLDDVELPAVQPEPVMQQDQSAAQIAADEAYAQALEAAFAAGLDDVEEQPAPVVEPVPAVQPASVIPPVVQPQQANQQNHEEEADDCAICFDGLDNGNEVRALPCAHSFHTACINPWIYEHANCPVCRASVNG